jgi:hypothetical protein
MTGSTLRHAVGQAVPARPDRITSQTSAIQGPPSRGKRVAIVIGTTVVLAGAVLTAVMWPGSNLLEESHAPAGETATVHLELDADAQIFLDGERQLPGKKVDLTVAARQEHELKVKRGGREKKVAIPALEAGATHKVELSLGEEKKGS